MDTRLRLCQGPNAPRIEDPSRGRLGHIVLVILCGFLLIPVTASADGPRAPLPQDLRPAPPSEDSQSGVENPKSPIENPKSKIQNPKSESRYVVRQAGAKRSLHQFQDKEGALVLTNRPDKYRRRKEYVELAIKYSRVIVPDRYRKLATARQYTSGTIAELVKRYSSMYSLDENLVYAVIKAESNFDPHAVSSKGCRGLMQLAPGTAAEMGVTDMFDPAQNIAGGTQYLAKMLNLFKNNVDLALAGYNAGPNAVMKHKGIPPYSETKEYIRRVREHARAFSGRRFKPVYHVASSKPKADTLPDAQRKNYIIHFRRGYTQPADNILDEDPYYYIQYGNRTALIRKEHVVRIEEPA